MIVIDANTGLRVRAGTTFSNIDGTFTVISVREKGRRAWAHLQDAATGRSFVTELKVRYLHPAFLFRKVGFIQS